MKHTIPRQVWDAFQAMLLEGDYPNGNIVCMEFLDRCLEAGYMNQNQFRELSLKVDEFWQSKLNLSKNLTYAVRPFDPEL